MAATATQPYFSNPMRRILQVIRLEKNEISSIYFYAILNGLIQLSLPLGIQSIVSFVLGGSFSTSLIVLISLVVMGVFFNGLLQVNQMQLIEKIQQKIFVRYAFEFAHRIPRLQLQAIDQYYLPELANRFFDTVSLQKGISKLLLDMPAATIQILFGLILLSFYHPVFIFFGITLVLIIYLILWFTSSKGMESSLRESDYKYAVAGWLEEMARVVNSFKFSRNRNLDIERTDELVQGYLKHRTTHFKVLQWQYWSLVAFKLAITAAMLIVGAILLVNQQLNIGQFIAAEIVILMVIGSVEKIMVNLDTVYDVLTSVEKLTKVTMKPMEESGTIPLEILKEGVAVELDQVSFSYSPEEPEVLKKISASIKPGSKVCIMGATGSGKSSLLRLVSGAYTQYSGRLFINGLPLSNYDLASLRSETGIFLCQQDIFQGTLMENITMGNRQIQARHILDLAQRIGLQQFLSDLKLGLDTPLDPIGKKLSRNIRHKILLLRALVNHPKLVLLEEPFEGISAEISASIQQYLLEETTGSTILVGTNNPQFASQCDQIILLDQGTVKASGTWESVKHLIA